MKLFLTVLISTILSFSVLAEKKETNKDNEIIVMTDDNTVALRTDFNPDSIKELTSKISQLDSKLPNGYPIYLFLNTPGGYIDSGLELYDFAKGINRPIHTITLFAASMGFQTVQNMGERLILPFGTLMSHRARGGIIGEFGGVAASQMDSRYAFNLTIIQELDKKTVERTKGKQTLQSYQNSYVPELWLLGKQAVERGYADRVVSVKCDSSLDNKTDILNVSFFMFNIEVEFYACPIRTQYKSISINIMTNQGKMKLDDFVVKGGRFGENCSKEDIVSSYWDSDSYKTVTSTPAKKLCAADPKINLETLKQELENYKKILNKPMNERIIYSF